MSATKKTWFCKGDFGVIEGHVEFVRDYILEFEGKFSHDLKALEKKYEKDIRQKVSDADFENHEFDSYADEFHRIDRVFLRTFRYSTIVTIYSLLETSMNFLCNRLKEMNSLSIEYDELRYDGIKRTKIYLEKICKIKFPEKSNEWSELVKLSQIRNCIVHADGDILRSHSPDKLKNIVKNTDGITLEHDRYLTINKKYVESAITWVKDFLQELYGIALPDR